MTCQECGEFFRPRGSGLAARYWPLLVGLGVVGMAGVAVTAAVGMAWRVTGRAQDAGRSGWIAVAGANPSREGETWTFRELAVYMNSRGVPVHMGPSRDGLGVIFAVDEDALTHSSQLEQARWSKQLIDGVVEVGQLRNAEDARQLAGRHENGKAFSWGKFYFYSGDVDYLSKMRKALAD